MCGSILKLRGTALRVGFVGGPAFEGKNPECYEVHERDDEKEAPSGLVPGALQKFAEWQQDDGKPEEHKETDKGHVDWIAD